MRVIFIQLYPHRLTDIQPSAERVFAKYVRQCGIIKEIEHLGIECEFANDERQIIC
jgi:hypothetical protein